MSDYPSNEWTKIWDALFWNFIDENQNFFKKNPRLGMMLNNWNKMNEIQKDHHKKTAENFLKNSDIYFIDSTYFLFYDTLSKLIGFEK